MIKRLKTLMARSAKSEQNLDAKLIREAEQDDNPLQWITSISQCKMEDQPVFLVEQNDGFGVFGLQSKRLIFDLKGKMRSVSECALEEQHMIWSRFSDVKSSPNS
ncbi:MAG: hypothetical protein AAF206_00160 [Bacteroidota bacterium]